jgi:hypothetical protein
MDRSLAVGDAEFVARMNRQETAIGPAEHGYWVLKDEPMNRFSSLKNGL